MQFHDGDWILHAQWLYDALGDEGLARNALSALCQRGDTVQVTDVTLLDHSWSAYLNVIWNDGTERSFPVAWLKVMARNVAKSQDLRAMEDKF